MPSLWLEQLDSRQAHQVIEGALAHLRLLAALAWAAPMTLQHLKLGVRTSLGCIPCHPAAGLKTGAAARHRSSFEKLEHDSVLLKVRDCTPGKAVYCSSEESRDFLWQPSLHQQNQHAA